jgi:predicted SnoaL-like aldol condensation-catalyzing enzyme
MKNFKESISYHWFEEIWNNGDDSLIDDLIGPNCRAYGLTPEGTYGPEGFRKFYNEFRSQYKDIHVTILNVIREKDYEVALCDCKAIHIDSGKHVHFTGTTMFRNEFGKIAESWNHYDFLSMYLQVGYTLTPPENQDGNQKPFI